MRAQIKYYLKRDKILAGNYKDVKPIGRFS